MSFLDKFKNSAAFASQAASVAANKAGTTAKTAAAIARLKVSVASEEDKLKKAYTELGRLLLRDMDAQVEADMTEYNPWCEKAHDALDAIARMTDEMNALKAELHTPSDSHAAEETAEAAAPAEAEAEAEAAPEAVVPAEEPAQTAAEEPAETAAVEAPAEEPAAAEEAPVEEVPEEEDTSIFADAD